MQGRVRERGLPSGPDRSTHRSKGPGDRDEQRREIWRERSEEREREREEERETGRGLIRAGNRKVIEHSEIQESGM